MGYIEANEILRVTNGGLDIILNYYPQARVCIDKPGSKFKVREDEKTASANLKQLNDGNYVLTDFGGDQTPRNGVQIAMLEEGCTYVEALKLLADKYVIGKEFVQPEAVKAGYSSRAASPDEEDGKWFYSIRQSFTDAELHTIFAPKIIEQIELDCRAESNTKEKAVYARLSNVLRKLHFHPVESYTIIKDRKAHIFSANEQYPIFLIDEGEFAKLYQPKHPDHSKRFMYEPGKKPKDFIHGLMQLQKAYDDLQKIQESSSLDDEGDKENKELKKLPEVILCTGGSDAVNVAALGYHVIWLNSETAKLSGNHFGQIMRMVNNFYNLPDIDLTGKKSAHELAMKFLDIRTIELPEELATRKDIRAKSCKDVRDFLKYYSKKAFSDLLNTALPYRFWDKEAMFDRKGNFKKMGYTFNNVQAYNFLAKNGFYRYQSENEKEGYIYIRIKGNIVEEIQANDIKNFIHEFLADRKMDIDLRNTFYKSTQLSENSLSNLPIIEIDFSDSDKDTQYFFFKNETWVVNAKEIKKYKPGEVNKFVWKNEVVPHSVKLHNDYFKITYDKDTEEYDIEILNTEDYFFRYLIQTSRIHWKTEFETRLQDHSHEDREIYKEKHKFDIAGPLLTEEERKEQKQHLINKIYALGYLLHRHKEPSRPWCVVAMDNKLSDEGESHGGSGKSIAFRSVRHFMTSVTLDGRNQKLTDNPHLYERVTKHTDYILIDDANQYLKFDFFFAPLTGELTVNPKNNKQYEIPFNDVPKFCITTNFTIKNRDPSTERRILYTVFSDYYHLAGESGDYLESRSPKNDFGLTLFNDFNEEDWNRFINFMVQCTLVYMNFDKIEPPMNNVTKRNLQTEMTDVFKNWADIYFSNTSGNLDRLIAKSEVRETFYNECKIKLWTPQRFSKALKAWCKYYGYVLNPKQLHNDKERIIKRVQSKTDSSITVAMEMIYIQTKAEIGVEAQENLPF